MVLTIIFLIRREVGDPEIRAQVDHTLASRNKGLRIRRCRPVREGEKEELDVTRRQRQRIRVDEFQAAVDTPHGGDDRREGLARVGARSHRRQCNPRVSEQEFDQDFAGVPGRTDNADFHFVEL